MKKQYRKSPRANWIDYDAGCFFVTVCTKNHIHYFGNIIDGKMNLSDIGKVAEYHLINASQFNKNIDIPFFVVMPNHIHIIVGTSLCDVNYINNIPPIEQRNPNPSLRANPTSPRHVPMLSRYISSLKGAVTKDARNFNPDFAWQDRYHDHLIRSHRDFTNIARYIEENPIRWKKDCFYS